MVEKSIRKAKKGNSRLPSSEAEDWQLDPKYEDCIKQLKILCMISRSRKET